MLVCLHLNFIPQAVNLTFDFPFYGHIMKHVIISTAGKCIAELNEEFVYYLTHKAFNMAVLYRISKQSIIFSISIWIDRTVQMMCIHTRRSTACDQCIPSATYAEGTHAISPGSLFSIYKTVQDIVQDIESKTKSNVYLKLFVL